MNISGDKNMIDAHIHADTRPYEDFERMAVAGIKKAVTCAHDPLKMSTSDVVLDHIHRIMENDTKRASENGLKLYTAVGVHPRSICNDYAVVIEKISELLEDKNVVAIGEIGLETTSKSEVKVFKEQLKLAQDLEVKVIVHTPRTHKAEVTMVTASIIEENIDTSLVLIDHVDNSIIDRVKDFDGILGLTVQPHKMTSDEAVEIMDNYGYDKFVLDSDMSSSPSDPLSVPKTVHKLKKAGVESKNIKKVSYNNAANFFKI
jgi:predicted metal-dependent TIM-barrel fold hydrolase